MAKIKVKEVNCATGEEIVRDATDIEIAQMETSRAKQLELDAKAEARATAKADLLAKLGITAEEAILLLS